MAVVTQPQQAGTQALVVLLQLAKRARSAESLQQLAFIMVNETLQLLHYRQAALWTHQGLGRIMALSGTPVPETNAPYCQWLSQVCNTLARATVTSPLPLTSNDLPPALAEEWGQWLPENALWLPLLNPQGQARGGLLLAKDTHFTQAEQTLALELTHAYQHAWHSLSPRPPLLNRLLNLKQVPHTRLAIALSVLFILCFPVHLSVLAPAEIIPLQPFLVRAPLEGVIDQIHVQPNQPVTLNTPLFSLDTTLLKTQHAIAQEAYNTAQEEYRQAAQLAVVDDKSKITLALRKGQMAEKSAELDYTAAQLGRVQVKAEHEGVAVFKDVNDWQGKAVVLGEKILLLANPKQVEMRIDLPASDVIELTEGAKVTLYPNGNPLMAIDATVTTIAYQAEATASGILAYQLKAQLAPSATPPRIGLMGTAKVYGHNVPLIYMLSRKPLAALRQMVGW